MYVAMAKKRNLSIEERTAVEVLSKEQYNDNGCAIAT